MGLAAQLAGDVGRGLEGGDRADGAGRTLTVILSRHGVAQLALRPVLIDKSSDDIDDLVLL
jgi:hypothetical protein